MKEYDKRHVDINLEKTFELEFCPPPPPPHIKLVVKIPHINQGKSLILNLKLNTMAMKHVGTVELLSSVLICSIADACDDLNRPSQK